MFATKDFCLKTSSIISIFVIILKVLPVATKNMEKWVLGKNKMVIYKEQNLDAVCDAK